MRKIELTQDKVAFVDGNAPAWIFKVKWCAIRTGRRWYAARSIYREYGKQTMQYLHRVLLDAKHGQDVDHIDGDGLNNQLSNLRIATRAQNLRAFKRPRTDNMSGFRGVSWNKQCRKWHAQIKHDGVNIHAGLYNTPEEAAHARDEKARSLGWPEAGMNFPLDSRTVFYTLQ